MNGSTREGLGSVAAISAGATRVGASGFHGTSPAAACAV